MFWNTISFPVAKEKLFRRGWLYYTHFSVHKHLYLFIFCDLNHSRLFFLVTFKTQCLTEIHYWTNCSKHCVKWNELQLLNLRNCWTFKMLSSVGTPKTSTLWLVMTRSLSVQLSLSSTRSAITGFVVSFLPQAITLVPVTHCLTLDACPLNISFTI